MLTIKQVAAHFRDAEFRFRFALDREVRLQMEAAAEVARTFIGNEQPGWDPLAASTIADKAQQGYPVPDPLKRTGALQQSISGEAETTPNGVRGVVGSTDPNALYHEVGTAKEPPRPFLGPALILAEPLLATALGKLTIRAATPGERL